MPVNRSFFDPALIEKWGAAFIREDRVDEALARLIPNVRITKGSYSCPGFAEQRDLLWNHMDQNHRPYIHKTYGEAMRMFIGERAALSLTRFGRWPVVIPVFDGHYKDNGFYQVLCLFGVIVVIVVIEANESPEPRMDVSWAIASHRLLRFLHPFLDRRLRRLNDVQNREDEGIRRRRVELRAKGYCFGTDNPDFMNSNVVSNNVIFPPVGKTVSISLADLPQGEPHQVDIGDRSYLVRRSADGVDVWPGVCPHEGAALGTVAIRGNSVKCPWHGLEFGMRMLRPMGGPIALCGARLSLTDGKLEIGPLQQQAT